MTKLGSELIDASGNRIRLDRQLASGGEGAVHSLEHSPNLVAKIYHQPPSPQTVQKVAAMTQLANPKILTCTAWPTQLLFSPESRRPVGFLMPRVLESQSIQCLYNPIQRIRTFPNAGWKFQLRVAKNLVAAFDEVHQTGCIVGDVNQSNVMVSNQALVHLIDCDSFQIPWNGQQFLCEVGVPHYTPPELQGRSFRGVQRTRNHDLFGLAVLIYQLLFVGRHPYAGIYLGTGDPSFEQLIAEYRFSQGPAAQSWNMQPPPHTPTFASIPDNVGRMFRSAFERGSEAGTRATTQQWLHVLGQLEATTTDCTVDPGHTYWNGAKSCVWCEIAQKGGPEYYFGVGTDSAEFAVDEAQLQVIEQRLRDAGPFDFPIDRKTHAPRTPPIGKPIPDELDEHQLTAIILTATLGICLVAFPFGVIHPAFAIIALFAGILFGSWLTVHLLQSPWHQEYRQRMRVLAEQERILRHTEKRWQEVVQSYQTTHAQTTNQLVHDLRTCRDLAAQYQHERHQLVSHAHQLAFQRHLRLYLLADADIPRIGAGRKQVLASHRIVSAVDIDVVRIQNIKGFGEVLTAQLLEWRTWVERQFQFDPNAALAPAEKRKLNLPFRSRQQQLLAGMATHLQRLESLLPSCQSELRVMVPALRKAIQSHLQAKADFEVMSDRQMRWLPWLHRRR
ncbi:protein kinase domain-containing protein [Tuwongella immobilis]|uniref:Protein kinase domain-containing protein n=1 Tax=Tuwongella immobilis TaxID=692036 RepID=A0A6C2YTK9_9BACT|nr:hypothetical protein [Tuwongella immobilis]VIP05068.1 hypothetical protein : Uncharacterized protein OS=Burkholderia sp. MP-1 GN=BG58_28640 PE=4 SV=1: Pkinase [Tuwongella immobilis]VTS07492.1 hypothetical protein : Uncharacterized protein OS=Burkholderia sp. MP-1 GN=BG58_28640 PE=4 SV=1: Pkinase [Tuwongella immobilis]